MIDLSVKKIWVSLNICRKLGRTVVVKQSPKWLNYGSAVKYSWVARDVTKNQIKKLSILLSFYFHEVLQYLNIFT